MVRLGAELSLFKSADNDNVITFPPMTHFSVNYILYMLEEAYIPILFLLYFVLCQAVQITRFGFDF